MSSRDTRIQDYTRDWNRLRDQKARKSGGVEARTLTSILFYFSEHYAEQERLELRGRTEKNEDKNKLHLVFNLCARAMSRRMGRLWSVDYTYRATPNTRDPEAFDRADIVSELIRALDYKLDEPMIHWNRLFWMMAGGVVIEHTPIVEDAGDEVMPRMDKAGNILWEDEQFPGKFLSEEMKDELVARGLPPERFKPAEHVESVPEVGSDLYSPLNFFIDASVKQIKDLAPDQSCYLADLWTVGRIRETFGSGAVKKFDRKRQDLNIVKTRLLDRGAYAQSLSLQDMLPGLTGSHADDDPDMAIVLTRYTPKSTKNPTGTRCIFSPDGDVYDETDLGSLFYEGIPLRDFHWRPNGPGFWSKDFFTDLIPPQKFLNKRWSQLGEAANSMIYEILLVGGGLTKASIPTDMPGIIEDAIDESTGAPMVQTLQRGQLPAWFPDTIKLCVEFVDALGGADLLTQRQFPGQLRGPLAIPMLQELIDSEDGPLYRHLGRALADVHQMRVNRVKAYYPPVRTLHYVGADNRNEVLVFHTSKVLKAGFDFVISVDPSSLLPELSSLREARVRERLESPLAALYVNPRSGQLDFSKIANDLKYGDRQRESRATQGRKLARQLISRMWKGEQIDPNIPMPFWPHDEMMDEYEAEMMTTEWLEASMPVKTQFVGLYQRHQAILQQQAQAQQQAMQSSMMHGAIAQATQQAAAKAASMATEEALTQVQAQQQVASMPPTPTDQVAAMLQSQRQGRTARPMPTRRPVV
jgi:hypothetical protein